MQARILAATQPGYISIEDDMIFAGHMAGICYMPDDYDTLLLEPRDKTLKRSGGCLNNRHHSVFQHTYRTILLEGVPKILAMVLNNEKIYNTSEKSGRYTFMQLYEKFDTTKVDGRERELYDKWYEIFECKICELYPSMTEVNARHLAQENARFLLSAFTPATTMAYTTTLCQFNYLLTWMQKFINQDDSHRPEGVPTNFGKQLVPFYESFINHVSPLVKMHGLSDPKNRELSLFARDRRNEEWGENYCINYDATFIHAAQALRHRTISYEIAIPAANPKFYVPEFIHDTPLAGEWLDDISSLAKNYPLGMLVHVNERGTIENFVLKLQERFCGHAQVEICKTTQANLRRYYEALAPTAEVLIGSSVASSNTQVHRNRYAELRDYLARYIDKPVCRFEDLNHTCHNPCYCGPDHIFDRKV